MRKQKYYNRSASADRKALDWKQKSAMPLAVRNAARSASIMLGKIVEGIVLAGRVWLPPRSAKEGA